LFQPEMSQNIANMSGQVIRDILKLTQQPDVISFAGGMPPTDALPHEALREISGLAFEKYGREVLQYGTSEGFLPLREFIVKWMAKKGVKAELEEVIVTSGSQQGIDLMAKAFLNQDDRVIMEKPTYLTAIQIFQLYGASFLFGDSDENGIVPSSLQQISKHSTNKLLYLVPNFQNPTGVTLSQDRRKELPGMMAELKLVLVEDDPYGDLVYDGNHNGPIKAHDQDQRVVYLGSFSKIISPGLRVGFAVAPEAIIEKLVIGKQSSDVHTCNLAQAMIYEFCAGGLLEPHLESLKNQYRKKRDLMLEVMDRHFPRSVSWNKPGGGLFIWVQLPAGKTAQGLLKEAVKEKVAFITGECFYVGGGGSNTLRLNFSNASSAQIEEGISRLGKVMHTYLA